MGEVKQNSFGGMEVITAPLYIPDRKSVDAANIRLDNPIGGLNNEAGFVKTSTVGLNSPVIAIHELNDHTFVRSDQDLYLDLAFTDWLELFSVYQGSIVWSNIKWDNVNNFLYGALSDFQKSSIDGSDWATGAIPGGAIQFSLDLPDIYGSSGGSSIFRSEFDGTGYSTFGTNGDGSGQFHLIADVHYNASTEYLYIRARNLASTLTRFIKTKFDGTGWTEYSRGIENWRDTSGFDYDNEAFYYGRGGTFQNLIKTTIGGSTSEFGSYGTSPAPGIFNTISKVHHNHTDGKIYVVDSGFDHVVRFDDMSGTNWETFGSSGSGISQFNFHSTLGGITCSNNEANYIFVVDYNNNRVIRFHPSQFS